jgi:hypothetical protein
MEFRPEEPEIETQSDPRGEKRQELDDLRDPNAKPTVAR